MLNLRKKYLCYSKIKLSVIYERIYKEKISSWKIQRIIQKYKLYSNPKKTAKNTQKHLKAVKKKCITDKLYKENLLGWVITALTLLNLMAH